MNTLYGKKQNPLSVCFFAHSAQLAGAERSLLELVTELIQDHGVMCSVILPNEGPLRGKLDDVGALTLIADYSWWCDTNLPADDEIAQRISRSFITTLGQLRQSIEKINPDVILTNTLVIPWGSVVASILNKPHVWFICEFGRLDHDLKFFLPFKRVLELVKESSNIIFTNSKAVQNELFGKKPEKNIFTVRRYIDISADLLSENKKDYFERKTATKLIIAGTICATKGQENAILAVNELIRQGKDVELIVVGYADQQYLKKLKNLVENEKLKDHVKFFDFKENIYPMLNHADIILVCSRNEAFGRTILEAMLLRKPVIATNSGGAPELIKGGFNGLLYEVGDYHQLAEKIKYLIEHNHRIEELGEHGYEFAKKEFTKEKYGGRIHEILMRIKNTKNPASLALAQFIHE
jgi:glycosyltransferase involved in cell wall biosynthesis